MDIMNRAAGTPLSETSAIARPMRPFSSGMTSKKSPPTARAGSMWPWIRKSGPSGNRVGRIDCCILLASSSSFCSTTSLSRDASASRHSAK